MLYDVFISHASEDKDSFVRPLAELLRKENIEVWYDEFSLQLGDSIRQSIDKGLRQSRFGIIVLSPAFFSKQWPQYELDGLVEAEISGNNKVILPIWHGIKHQEIFNFSPSLANRRAVSSSQGLDIVVKNILRVVKPQGSPLIIARDVLLQWGITPPVVTDQYWLEVVEASNRVPAFGATVPVEANWGRWTFPLPEKSNFQTWGERLAWTALQLRWSEAAEIEKISPLTPPEEVLKFISNQPGLYEVCKMFPTLLIEYAPQLTIPGMGGDFECIFDELYQQSVKKYSKMLAEGNTAGTGLTINREVPLCDEEWALRDSVFGDYEPVHIVCEYFSGGMFGPPVSPYSHADHLVWLLSDSSNWLPQKIHDYFIEGMATWGTWLWDAYSGGVEWKFKGELGNALYKNGKKKDFRWTTRTKKDAINCFADSIKTLSLVESPETILERFIEYDFPNKFIKSRKNR